MWTFFAPRRANYLFKQFKFIIEIDEFEEMEIEASLDLNFKKLIFFDIFTQFHYLT